VGNKAIAGVKCPNLIKAAAEVQMEVAFQKEDEWKITNEKGNVFHVTADEDLCIYNMIAVLGDSFDGAGKGVLNWNLGNTLAKVVDDGDKLMMDKYAILPDATDRLLSINLLLFDVTAQGFLDWFGKEFPTFNATKL
jgi:hypothetical protein